MKKNKRNQTLNVEEIACQNPILTEEELKNNFYTYEELVEETLRLFDEGVKEINHKYGICEDS